MTPAQMKARTKAYAFSVLELSVALPRGLVVDVLNKQLVRSATSIGANYRAACRAKSSADFISKMKTVEEEADESLYWMELLVEGRFVQAERVRGLMTEGNELLSIVVASIKTKRG